MIRLRSSATSDMISMWRLRNSESVRNNSHNSTFISYAEHTKWFDGLRKDKNQKSYAIMVGENKAGYVRYTSKSKSADLHILLNSRYRGKGIGRQAVIRLSEILFNKKGINTIRASVKSGNKASIRMFNQAGFKVVNRNRNITVLELHK